MRNPIKKLEKKTTVGDFKNTDQEPLSYHLISADTEIHLMFPSR